MDIVILLASSSAAAARNPSPANLLPPASTVFATAAVGLERLVALSRACGIPQRLRDVGVPESDLPRFAQEAMKVTRLLKNNPRELTATDALEIYRAAYWNLTIKQGSTTACPRHPWLFLKKAASAPPCAAMSSCR